MAQYCFDGVFPVIFRALVSVWACFTYLSQSSTHRLEPDSKSQTDYCTTTADMDLDLEMELAVINRVQELLVDDRIQFNKHQFKYLAKKLTKTKKALDNHNMTAHNRKSALRELLLEVKRLEELVHKCMFQDLLDGALAFETFNQEVVDIRLGLSWWTSMVNLAAPNGAMQLQTGTGTQEEKEEEKAAVTLVVQKHEYLLKKLSTTGSKTMQKARDEDKADLHRKLTEIVNKREYATSEYVLAVYLLVSQFNDDEFPVELVESQLKEFKWVKMLGEGGQAQVFEVTWLNRKCALKVSANDVRVSMKENGLLRRCNHPHIVKVFWYWEEAKISHLMMEWMPKNLATHIEDELKKGRNNNNGAPLALHVAIDIMLQIAKAMLYLHSMKIVHRDLKPSNVLVQSISYGDQSGYMRVKLADFGVAKNYNHTMTTSLQTLHMGTTVYAAPEIFERQEQEDAGQSLQFPPMADVWSFGITCSQILTGEGPFEDEPRMKLHARIVEEKLRPSLPEHLCPKYLRVLINRCWKINPARRPSFVEIYKMLKLAKAVSLGVMPFDACKHLFFNRPWRVPPSRLDDTSAAANPFGPGFRPKYLKINETQSLQNVHGVGEEYIIVGTSFRIYTDKSKTVEMLDQNDMRLTGIKRLKGDNSNNKIDNNVLEALEPFEVIMMEGRCWTKPAEVHAYGCLTGIFVKASHAHKLRENNIKAIEGGFIGETDVHSRAPQTKKFAWGFGEKFIWGFDTDNYLSLASFYSLGEDKVPRYIYVYMSYNLTKHAVVSHMWHGENLVLGDTSMADMSLGNIKELGSNIIIDLSNGEEHTTSFKASISYST